MIFSNRTLYLYFTVINLINFIDRGIVPGAITQFNAFITSNLNTTKPDAYLGLLQSAFVAGYSVSCIIAAHLLHSYRCESAERKRGDIGWFSDDIYSNI